MLPTNYSCTNYIYIYIYIRGPTVLESDLKIPFIIAITQKCTEGYYPFPCIAPLTLGPHLIMLSVKQGGIRNKFLSLRYILDMGLKLDFPDH